MDNAVNSNTKSAPQNHRTETEGEELDVGIGSGSSEDVEQEASAAEPNLNETRAETDESQKSSSGESVHGQRFYEDSEGERERPSNCTYTLHPSTPSSLKSEENPRSRSCNGESSLSYLRPSGIQNPEYVSELHDYSSQSSTSSSVRNIAIGRGCHKKVELGKDVVTSNSSESEVSQEKVSSGESVHGQRFYIDEGQEIRSTYTVHHSNEEDIASGKSDSGGSNEESRLLLIRPSGIENEEPGSQTSARSLSLLGIPGVGETNGTERGDVGNGNSKENQGHVNSDSENEEFYDSSDIIYDVEIEGDKVDCSAAIPRSLEIEIPVDKTTKVKIKRKRRPRKRKRVFDAPNSKFLCANKGCQTIFESEGLLEAHFEGEHGGG